MQIMLYERASERRLHFERNFDNDVIIISLLSVLGHDNNNGSASAPAANQTKCSMRWPDRRECVKDEMIVFNKYLVA